ncbi:hypothetical protein Zmor_021775 [Zophobas morio]|uniref:Uncharacterized protein n=1 Tax=Zophobas morio TaxID=2755281 RepID=A0AA38I986_9CUCU|nr:hypothetical protein Zmor_021775 [Zophobas morio]
MHLNRDRNLEASSFCTALAKTLIGLQVQAASLRIVHLFYDQVVRIILSLSYYLVQSGVNRKNIEVVSRAPCSVVVVFRLYVGKGTKGETNIITLINGNDR